MDIIFKSILSISGCPVIEMSLSGKCKLGIMVKLVREKYIFLLYTIKANFTKKLFMNKLQHYLQIYFYIKLFVFFSIIRITNSNKKNKI